MAQSRGDGSLEVLILPYGLGLGVETQRPWLLD